LTAGRRGGKSVLVIGSTGLVGSECVRLLTADSRFSRVVALVRSGTIPFGNAAALEVERVDFDNLDAHRDLFEVDQVICALGTTMRKTPSRDIYRKIDYDYPIRAARLAQERGASHYLVVTAAGASSRSRLFYNCLKGELEDALVAMNYRSLTIARPSVLIGNRTEPRRSERIAWKLSFMTPSMYKPVPAANVSRALVNAAGEDAPGVRIIQNRELLDIA
jgi:uncharacterized protein YbjT (DUF2867 family)